MVRYKRVPYKPSVEEIAEVLMKVDTSPELCDCGELPVWLYMPGGSDNKENPFACDNCVSRGCTCNEGELDENDRELPCCEWMWIGN